MCYSNKKLPALEEAEISENNSLLNIGRLEYFLI